MLREQGLIEEDASLPTLRRRDRNGPEPLSFAQQRLWFLDQLAPGNPTYNLPTTIRFDLALDVGALNRSLNTIVARHESLRTTFVAVDGRPMQIVVPALELEVPVVDLRSLRGRDREAEAVRLTADEARRPFDLATGPLVRAGLVQLGDVEWLFLLTMHHIVSDGWSLGVFAQELDVCYRALAVGREPELPDLPVQYADFAWWQREWLNGDILAAQLDYWGTLLTDVPVLALPTDRPRPTAQSFRGAGLPVQVPATLTHALRGLAQKEGCTLFMVLLAAFQALLGRTAGQNDVVVGVPIANRTRPELERLIGFFVNSLVLRTDTRGDPTFVELLGRVREVALSAYAHQDLPFEMLVDELQPERDPSRNPLFQVTFQLFSAPGGALPLEASVVNANVPRATAKFDLYLEIVETTDGLHGAFEYSTDLFDAATIERLSGHYLTLLAAVAAEPDSRLSELEVLTPAERRQVVLGWNDTTRPYPRDATVAELFTEQAARRPDAVAVVSDRGTLTYAELDARSNRLAHYLVAHGAQAEGLVGICMPRSADLVVAILAVLKTGAAYVPLDPDYPAERLAFMLRDTAAPLLVAVSAALESVPEYTGTIVCVDRDADAVASFPPDPMASGGNAESLAYVMYTSGSTGEPKGVMVPNRGIVRLVVGSEYVRFAADEVFLQLAPISFDASTFEIWGALLHGARLVVFPRHKPSLEELGRALRDHGVTTLWLTAGLFDQMVDDHMDDLRGVRQLLAGGDVLSPGRVRRVLRELPECRMVNGYGPTEGTTFTCCHTVDDPSETLTAVPIGRPIANTRVYLLDHERRPVDVGTAGELYIGGDGLARGYLNRAHLTAERFVPDPFSADPAARLYRTGDLARYRRDGVIEFIGRSDDQVKLRGFRVEPGEVATVLESHPSVREAVVVVREDIIGDRRLVAYVVPTIMGGDGMSAVQVDHWRALYDETYDEGEVPVDQTFDITGWKSSYTGAPIPADEMREWRDSTAERVLATRPHRVLEVGCGTGLLLFAVAPSTEAYIGVDFSDAVIARLTSAVAETDLDQVRLAVARADETHELGTAIVDTVVLNSVVQYFPNVEYLVSVLEAAVAATSTGGSVFVGDVRNLAVLDAFHADVLATREAELSHDQQRAAVARAVAAEEELIIDPAFFHAFAAHLPRVTSVAVAPKRGRRANELVRFRYDVTLGLDRPPASAVAPVDWVDVGDLKGLARDLATDRDVHAFARIPDARITPAPARLASDHDLLATPGVDPEDLWALGERLGYRVELELCHDAPGHFDAIFRRRGAGRDESPPAFAAAPLPSAPWSAYANRPLEAALARALVPGLRQLAQRRLPDYMVPSAFVLLDALPLSPNGKVDRRALPGPSSVRLPIEAAFVAPRTPTEAGLAELWADVLGLDAIGVEDDFFADLGGHSLLGTQLVSRIRDAFRVELPLRRLFDAPTIAGLARILDGDDPLVDAFDDEPA